MTTFQHPDAKLWRNPIHLLAFGFGAGCAPKAPGTFGTLVAIPMYWLLQGLSLWLYLSMAVLLFVLGIWLCGRTARDLGVHDHSGIVWDEIVGYLVVMTAAPTGWLWMIVGFGLFRLFDILKPWPINIIDEGIGGGFGIMLDDLLAGVYACVVLQMLALNN